MVTPKTPQQAYRLARCYEKALEIAPEMRKGGLYVTGYGGAPGKIDIMKRGYNGEKDVWYTVDLINQTCDCPDFLTVTHRDTCKHVLACEINADLELVEEYEQSMADSEGGVGTDPHYWIDLRYAS